MKKRKVSVNSVLKRLGIFSSGYYSWKKRELSEQEKIKVEIIKNYNESHQINGAPKITAILRSRAYGITEKQLAITCVKKGIKPF